MSPPSRPRLFLIGVLLGLCLLAYVPAPPDADGQAVLTVAVSAVRFGSADIDAIGFTEWFLTDSGKMGSPGADGALYAKKGFAPSLLLAPFVIAADALPWLTVNATAMLFNALVTTAAAVCLHAFARRLGYGPWVALALALVYGAATFAITYVKTLFGEPLVALLLLGAVMCAHAFRAVGGRWRLAAVGGLLALCAGTNTIYILLALPLALYIFWPSVLPRAALPQDMRRLAADLAAFTAPLVGAAALLGLYNWVRFGSPLESGYGFASGEGFITPLWTGLYGMLLSPYRGLFWYNPLLLLALPGWFIFRRRAPRLAWLILALTVIQLVTFALWWSWHGGIVWGPRFLLVPLPLLTLLLAPIFESAARSAAAPDRPRRSGRALLRVAVIALIVLSVGVQLLGVLLSYLYYEAELFATYWPDLQTANVVQRTSPPMYDPALSPILGHLRLLRDGFPLDPAWLRGGVDVLHLGAALLLIGAGLVAGFVARLPARIAALLTLAAALVALNLVPARQQARPEQAAIAELDAALQPPGVLLAATERYHVGLLDLEGGSRVVAMNAPTNPADPRANAMWQRALALAADDTLWYVSWFSPAHPENWQERALFEQAFFVTERPLSDHRALWFDFAPDPSAHPGGWRFGPLALDAYGVSVGADGVHVALRWFVDQPAAADYTWFVHLLDSTGAIIAQQDRAPLGGFAPVTGWTPGVTLTDRLCFPLPPAADTTGWMLRVGWIDPATGDRLPAAAPDGAPLSDGFALLPLR